MPLISVILPNYNHGKFLKERIDSILNQTFQDFELIILDDASGDNSADIIQSYVANPRIALIELAENNSGSTFIQWKKGLDAAKGTYIWLAESDDVAGAEFLASCVAAFEADPSLGVVYAPSHWINEEGEIIHSPEHEERGFSALGPEIVKTKFLKGCLIYNASSAVFKKELTKAVDFDELLTFKFAGDWFFWVSLLSQTRLHRLEKRLNYFRRHENNVSFKSEREGLNFTEGFRIVSHILKHFAIGFVQRQKTLLYWVLNVYKSDLEDKSSYIRLLPAGAGFWYALVPLLSRFR